jgi:hypothetical protein
MARNRFKGIYVPDKDGKLRPVLRLSDTNAYLPATASTLSDQSAYPDYSLIDKTWKWLKRYF